VLVCEGGGACAVFTLLNSLAGAATGQSDFGTLPAGYPSPSPRCTHDLGGLRLLGAPIKDATGDIVGVKSVSVTCTLCTRESKGKTIKNRTISIKAMLADARALFARFGWPTEAPQAELGRCCAFDDEDELRPLSELGECIGPHDDGSLNNGFEYCLDCLTSRADLGLVCRACTANFPCSCPGAADGECNGGCFGYGSLKAAVSAGSS